MTVPFYHILNQRARLCRHWREFRQWERYENERHKDLYRDDNGSLRVPSVEDTICQLDSGVEEHPLDGKLSW